MAVKDLQHSPKDCRTVSTSPSTVLSSAWFYEEQRGLVIAVQHNSADGSQWLGTSQHVIPWGHVRRSLERRDRASESNGDTT